MDRNFKPLFYERSYIASAPSLSSTAELSKSCGLVGVLDGRVGVEIAGARGAGRAARISEVQAFVYLLGFSPFLVHDSLLHNSGLFELGVSLRPRSRQAFALREDCLK